jgi:hypothetical protein
MSIAEIERFAADLKSNPALWAQAEKSQADESHAMPLKRPVAFAASKGYGFTIEEARPRVQARAGASRSSSMRSWTVWRGNCVLGFPVSILTPGG